jgi:hypothetical protein
MFATDPERQAAAAARHARAVEATVMQPLGEPAPLW